MLVAFVEDKWFGPVLNGNTLCFQGKECVRDALHSGEG